MTLTKANIISAIQEQIGIPRKEASDIIEILLEIVKKRLSEGEDILISGFGKFCVREKKQRRGRNPATGEDMMLGRRRVVTFKCSSSLRRKLN
jgi:integration host factor subunit alpha